MSGEYEIVMEPGFGMNGEMVEFSLVRRPVTVAPNREPIIVTPRGYDIDMDQFASEEEASAALEEFKAGIDRQNREWEAQGKIVHTYSPQGILEDHPDCKVPNFVKSTVAEETAQGRKIIMVARFNQMWKIVSEDGETKRLRFMKRVGKLRLKKDVYINLRAEEDSAISLEELETFNALRELGEEGVVQGTTWSSHIREKLESEWVRMQRAVSCGRPTWKITRATNWTLKPGLGANPFRSST